MIIVMMIVVVVLVVMVIMIYSTNYIAPYAKPEMHWRVSQMI